MKIAYKDKNTIVIITIVVLNIYAQFLQKKTGINSFFFSLIPLVYLVLINGNNMRRIKMEKFTYILILIAGLSCFVQITYAKSLFVVVKNIVYIFAGVLVSQIANSRNTWKCFKKAVCVIGCLMSLDVFVQLPKVISIGFNWYNVRNYTMLDKPMYSLMLTFATLYLCIELIYKEAKNKLMNIILIITFMFVNLVAIQSKASMLCFIIGFAIFILSTTKKKRRKIVMIVVFVILIVAVYYFENPDKIPIYIKTLLYQYFGLFSNEVAGFGRYMNTYSTRSRVYTLALELYKSSPILGIGFGNFSNYGLARVGVAETESSFISLFVEGGIIYAFSHVILLVNLLINLWRTTKRKGYPSDMVSMLVTLVLYIVFSLQNDYMSLIYWIFIGLTIKEIGTSNEVYKKD